MFSRRESFSGGVLSFPVKIAKFQRGTLFMCFSRDFFGIIFCGWCIPTEGSKFPKSEMISGEFRAQILAV